MDFRGLGQGISVRKNAEFDERYERNVAQDGSPYFILRAANREVIGKSEMYSTPQGMENGIDSVKRNALGAALKDDTH